ncbi:MAG: hypothetical protein GEV09_09745 [Pseudonocardiaceae bacterium]|nr:hypothetical protein [Pseudonocardiaceae bacterium]
MNDNLREQIPEQPAAEPNTARCCIARLLAMTAVTGLSPSFSSARPGGPSAKNAHQAGLSNTQARMKET